MEITDFEKIASSLTVRSICSPLGPDIRLGPDDDVAGDLDDATQISIIKGMSADRTGGPVRVIRSGGKVLGMVRYRDLYDMCLFEALERLEPSEFLSADTNILEAIHLFSSGSQYYYILEKNDVVGILYYSDIFKPLGRLAFLALALEIEQLALDLCSVFHLRDQCWEALSKKRQAMARALYKKRHGHSPKKHKGKGKYGAKNKGKYLALKELIECTYLSDKANMIWKNRLIRASSRKSVLRFFHRLDEIRDLCAHAHFKYELEEKFPRERFGEFIETARGMSKNLFEAVAENRVKESKDLSKLIAELGLDSLGSSPRTPE